MVDIDNIISDLQNRLTLESERFTAITQTRSFFRQGREETRTIGSTSDIDKKRDLINTISEQLQDALRTKENIQEEEIIIQEEEIIKQEIQQVSIPVSTEQNNTVRNALIIGGLALLVL